MLTIAGCANTKSSQKKSSQEPLLSWPWWGKTTDEVPGITPPGKRISEIRALGQKAASASPEQRQQISADLARQYRAEADPLLRMEIVRAIREYPTSEAGSILLTALNDSDPDVRVVACRALGQRGGAEATTALSRALSSDVDADVRLAGARALGQTGDAAAVPALGTALEDRDPAMQVRAVASLRKITGKDLGNDVDKWRQYVKGETPAKSEPVSLAERIRRAFSF